MRNERNDNDQPHLSWLCKISYLLFAACGILYFIFTRSPSFADWFNQNISQWGRRILNYITVWLPFSVAEAALLWLPALVVGLIEIATTRYSKSWRSAGVFVGKLLAVLCIVGILFVCFFAPGYYGTTLDKKLGLDRQPVSNEELTQTATLLSRQLSTVSQELIFTSATSSSVMPYSYREMNDKLMTAYTAFSQKNDFLDQFWSTTKRVMISKAMSYTHITGVYSFFTGEANINVNFPDYTIPFTAAHELAHQRGIAREDEANMIAFLVCMESEDAYIRYSALLSVFEYVSSALYSADWAAYSAVYASLPDSVVQEERAYAAFFEQYRDHPAASVSTSVNNAYLQSQGAKEGTRSYNMVVDLTVAYYRNSLSTR